MTVLGGVVSAHSPSKAKHKLPYVIAFIALGGAAVVIVVQLSTRTTRSETELRDSIKTLAAKADEAARLQTLNSKLQADLLALSKLNVQTTRESIATVTGGDSFCYMDFNYQFDRPFPVFLHEGRYPLYDVNVRIVDLFLSERAFEEHHAFNQASETRYTIHELGVALMWIDSTFSVKFSDERVQAFNVFFGARNGTWTETLLLKKVNDHWVHAIRVLFAGYVRPGPPPESSRKPVYENVAREFPLDANGTVPWDNLKEFLRN